MPGPRKKSPVFRDGALWVVVMVQRWKGYRSIAVYVPFSIDAMPWTSVHLAFVVEEYMRNRGSAISTQWAFRVKFQLARHDSILDRNKMQAWVSNLRAAGSAPVEKPSDCSHARKCVAPKRSLCKHTAALEFSDSSVSIILWGDLHKYPYKMMITRARIYMH